LLSALLCLTVGTLSAQDIPDPEHPAWLAYEKGRLEMSRKDFGKAIFYFREALARNNIMPEAELALGDVYFIQGDYPVAERQFQRAYDQRAHFIIPDLQYQALYRLARLYSLQRQYGKMAHTLTSIIRDDPVASGQERVRKNFRRNLMRLFNKKGFNETFLLNRISESFATEAQSLLAEYYYKAWNFEPALEPSLLAIIALVTEGMLQIRKEIYDYRFTTLDDFLKTGLAIPVVRDYLQDRDFFRRLFYLALICYETKVVLDSGRYFLRILTATDTAGQYQRLARLHLRRYQREPRIDAPVIESVN
jgi:tetratricopeptide (TPR) repeat protein